MVTTSSSPTPVTRCCLVDTYARRVDCEQVWITVRDGTRLAADLYLPRTGQPAAALLEALPYRKDDLTVGVALRRLPPAALQRVASPCAGSTCAAPARRAGGPPTSTHSSELDDLADVIAWLAVQPWCNGRVGMFGYSYSGFNSLQLACERPPALGAICAIYATDDRYTDDVHYMGGALRAIDLVDYCHYMVPMNALPPVPALWGDGWRDEWLARIAEHEPWLFRWMEEQHRRSVLAARFGAARLRTHRVRDDARRRMGRRLPQQHLPHVREPAVREGVADRPMEPHGARRIHCPGRTSTSCPEMITFFGKWLARRPVSSQRPPIRVFVRHATKPEPDLAIVRRRMAVRGHLARRAAGTGTTLYDGRRRSLVDDDPTPELRRGTRAPADCRGVSHWISATTTPGR